MSARSRFNNKRTSHRDKIAPTQKPYVPAPHLPAPVEWSEKITQLPLDSIDDFNQKIEIVNEEIDGIIERKKYFYHMPDGRKLQVADLAKSDYCNGHYALGVMNGENYHELIVRDGYVWRETRTAYRIAPKAEASV